MAPFQSGTGRISEMVQPDLDRLLQVYNQWKSNPSFQVPDSVQVAADAIDRFIGDNFISFGKNDRFPDERSLEIDGEDVIVPVCNHGLLLLAESLLEHDESPAAARLSLHCAMLHQSSLSAPSPSLLKRIDTAISRLSNGEIDANLSIEIAIALIGAGQYVRAKPFIEQARVATGLKAKLTGVMGKRTKFQKEDRAQLVARIETEGRQERSESAPFPDLIDQLLDDDTLLDEIQFSTPGEVPVPALTPVQSAIMLAWADIVDYENLVDDIKRLEQLAYLEHSLKSSVWTVRLRSLLRRSMLESTDIHRRIRSLRQLESLVDVVLNQSPHDRRQDFFLALPVPFSFLKLSLAKLQENMLLNSSALAIYTDLDIWEPVMRLHVKLGRSSEAQKMLIDKMERQGPTPRLQCVMGDVTMDPEWYHAAWRLSKERYSRAQRSLADLSFTLQKWNEAIEHYHLALAINPIFPQAWFQMGYAALQIKDYTTAAMAFSRSVNLRPNDGDAQNNLAASYLEKKQMPLAFQALKACVRLKSGEWKVWDNYLTAAMGISDLQAAAYGFSKVLELQRSCVDARLLKSFCDAVVESRDDEFLQRRTKELLHDICNQISDNADLFGVASDFFAAIGDSEVAASLCYKQCLALENPEDWSQNGALFTRLVKAIADFINLDNAGRKSRLLLQRVLANADKCPNLPSSSVEDLQNLLSRCSTSLENPAETYRKLATDVSDMYASDYI